MEINEIEYKVAQGEMTASQCFTQMLQHTSKRRPLLIEKPEPTSMIPEAVQKMLDNEGLYIAGGSILPWKVEAPFLSMGGKVYSMVVDNELDPTRFIEGTQISGPFRAPEPDDSAPVNLNKPNEI